MSVKKKRVVFVIVLCFLFILSAAGSYFFFEFDNLSLSLSGLFKTAPVVSFPDAVSAQAEFNHIPINGSSWYQIILDLPDKNTAKELYELETWVSRYNYDETLQSIPWTLTVNYTLSDGSTVTREYQKSGLGEVLSSFVKEHEQYVVKKVQNFPNP